MAAGIMKIGEYRVLQILQTEEGKNLINAVGYEKARTQIAKEILKQMSIGMTMAGVTAVLGTVGIVKLAALSLGIPVSKIIMDVPLQLMNTYGSDPVQVLDKVASGVRTASIGARNVAGRARYSTDYWITRYFIYNLFREGISASKDIIEWLTYDASVEEQELYEKEILDLGTRSYDSLIKMGFNDEQIKTIFSEYARLTNLPKREIPIEEPLTPFEEQELELDKSKLQYGETQLKQEAIEDWLNMYESLISRGHTPDSAVSEVEAIFGWVLPSNLLDPILDQDLLDYEESLQPEDATLAEFSHGDIMEWVQDAVDTQLGGDYEEYWEEDERILQGLSAGIGLDDPYMDGYQQESFDNGDFPEFHAEMNDSEFRKDERNMAYGRFKRRYSNRKSKNGVFKDRFGVWRWSNSGKRVNQRR